MRANLLEGWFLRQKNRADRFSSIQDLLFSDNAKRYIEYRLRLFNLQVIFRFLIHLFLVSFLFSGKSRFLLLTTILAYALDGSIKSFFWGALEALREKVRMSHRIYDSDNIARLIGAFVLSGFLISLMTCLFYIIFSWFYLKFVGHMSLFDNPVFIGVSAFFMFSWFIELPLMAYHSGIYAITRIMRPNFSIIAPDCLFLVLFGIFYPWIGSSAFVIIAPIYFLIKNFLRFYYTFRMYKLYQQPFVLIKSIRKMSRILKSTSRKTFFMAGLAGFSMSVDVMLLGMILLLAVYFNISQQVIIYLFLIMPMLSASTDWAKLFYFDRKKYEDRTLQRFIMKYDLFITRASVIIGVVYWITASIAAYFFLGEKIFTYNIFLLVYFILRPKIADAQVTAFCGRSYKAVCISGLSLSLLIALILFLNADWILKFLLLGILLIAGYKTLRNQTKKIHFVFSDLYVNMYQWIERLVLNKSESVIITIKISHQIQSWKKLTLFRGLINEYFSDKCVITETGNNEFIFLDKVANIKKLLSSEEAYILSGGIISKFSCTLFTIDKTTKIDGFLTIPGLRKFFTHHDIKHTDRLPSKHIIIAEFLKRFTNGIYFDPFKVLGSTAIDLNDEEARTVNSKLKVFLNHISRKFKTINTEGVRNFDVTFIYDKGIIETVFLIPYSESVLASTRKNVHQWRAIIHHYNLDLILQSIECLSTIPNENGEN